MFQDSITVKNRHLAFIKTISDNELVYVLQNENGFATSNSNQYKDDNGSPIGMLYFWADKVRAKSCAINEWKEYKVTEILLAEFMENWCIGMANDGLLVGTQFDQNMFGFTIEPLELVLELTSQLKSIRKDLNFRKFNGISDLKKQVKERTK